MDVTSLTYITAFMYLMVSAMQYRQIRLQTDNQCKFIALFSTLPIIGHGLILHQSIDTHLGQNLSIANIFSMVFWLITILIMVSSIYRKLGPLVITILPISAISIFVSMFLGNQSIIDASATNFLIHSLLSITAMSIISLSAFQSIYVNRLDTQLKSFTGSTDDSMPSLQDMEQFLYILIWSGFVFLTLSIISAVLFTPNTGASVPLHKPILSISSWLVFATLLAGRHFKGWRGHTVTRLTIVGFSMLFLAYFGTRTVVEFILGR